ncbi:MAG TPA: hypothetical protein VIH59_05155 [Candidatus Tectomicrobia bacterium]|jgi:hypothetical protein
MSGPEKQTDADHPDLWLEFEAVVHDIETPFPSTDVRGDPTAPWEEIEDQAVITMSGALLKALCDIAAQADGAMEWGPDSILLHAGISAPVPLRFQACRAR